MTPAEFLQKVEATRPHFPGSGHILAGVQHENSSFTAYGYDGTAPNGVTHLNSALYGPTEAGTWSETGLYAKYTLALVLDDQGNPAKAASTPKVRPTWILETSAGSQQWVYLYSHPVPTQKGKNMAVGAVHAGLSDPFIAQRHHHWFRLAGSLPKPKIKEGKTTPAKLIEWNGGQFDYDDLAARLGVTPTEVYASIYSGAWEFDAETGYQDPVFHWLLRRGLIDASDARGFHNVVCPNAGMHSEASRPWARYLPPNAKSNGAFMCHHAHCNGVLGPTLDLTFMREWVEAQGGPTVAEARQWASKMWRRQQKNRFEENARTLSRLPADMRRALQEMKK